MMKRILGMLCLVMVVSGLGSSIVAQDDEDSDAPYIYYYSDILNAFVIERADGTDSRLFAANLMPENTDIVTGAGWSPTGQFFAWSAGRHGSVVNTAGEQQLDFLNDYFQAEVIWSPIDDIAMVVGLRDILSIDEASREAIATLQFLLIDVVTEETISHYEKEVTIFYVENEHGAIFWENLAHPEVHWMSDGQHVIVSYYAREPIPEQPFIVGFQIFDLSGGIHEIIHDEDMLRSQGSYFGANSIGKIAFNDADDPTIVIIEDLISGEQIGAFSTDIVMRRVVWSPTGEAALFLDEPEIWLWRAGIDSFQLIVSDAGYYSSNRPMWSPNGEYAIVLKEDRTAQFLTLQNASLNSLPITGQTVAWQWTDNNRLLISNRDEENLIYDIDLSTQRVYQTFMRHNPYSLYEIGQWSPDETQFAYVDHSLEILNLENQMTTTFRPDGRSWFSAPGGEAYWSSDGNWLIVAEEAVIAGGGAPRWIGVAKSDGSNRRDLASCWDSACFGWLPDNVDIDQLPLGQPQSVLPQPTRILSGTDWTFYLSWSPDGSQILRGKSDMWDGGGLSTIIDVETVTVIGEFAALDFDMGVEWTLNDGQYGLQVVQLDYEVLESGETVVTRSPDGELLIVDDSRQLYVYYHDVGEMLPLSGIDVNALPLADFSPDGTLLAVSRPHSRTGLYNATTWELITTLNTNGTAVAFSPDGQTLAVGSSWDIQLWDVATLLETVDESSEE